MPVKSGIPHGMVLGKVLFLSFINDLQAAVKSKVHLFADDCVMYHAVRSDSDCILLQEDLNRLKEWEHKLCMQFNATKCSSIPITRKRNKQLSQYTLHNQPLEQVNSATYLGVELSSDLTWAKHRNKACNKANRNLGFI